MSPKSIVEVQAKLKNVLDLASQLSDTLSDLQNDLDDLKLSQAKSTARIAEGMKGFVIGDVVEITNNYLGAKAKCDKVTKITSSQATLVTPRGSTYTRKKSNLKKVEYGPWQRQPILGLWQEQPILSTSVICYPISFLEYILKIPRTLLHLED